MDIWSDGTAQAEAIRDGSASAEELTREYLARIERLDDQTCAYVTVDAAGALERARAADRRRREAPESMAPLEGVTLSIKDMVDVAGLPTTYSCEALKDHIPTVDDPLVRRFRDAGLVILGKTNVPEFGTDMTTSKLNGTSRNPWDLALTPGGSSGGAAAAMAAGMCAMAHGTDGAGSVRVPAAFCGLVGMKPTRGLVAFGPDEGSPLLGTVESGPLVRSVRDAAAFLDAAAPMGGWTPSRPQSFRAEAATEPGPLRVAVTSSFPLGTVDPACRAAAEGAASVIEALGHHVEEATPKWEVILALAGLGFLSLAPSAILVSLEDAHLIEPRNQPTYHRSVAMTLLEHYRMVESVRAASRDFGAFWDDYDVLVTPTAGWLPPPVEWARWDDDAATHGSRFASFPNFAQPFNLSGQPAISLPLGWTGDGFPVGVQLAGRKLEDGLLFRLAAQLEQERPWSSRTVATGKSLG